MLDFLIKNKWQFRLWPDTEKTTLLRTQGKKHFVQYLQMKQAKPFQIYRNIGYLLFHELKLYLKLDASKTCPSVFTQLENDATIAHNKVV